MATATVVALGLAACSSPSKNNGGGSSTGPSTATQHALTDPNAKGPAPDVPGAKKGGTITVLAESTPNAIDPTDIYYTDGSEIARLIYRSPTQFQVKDGQPVLIPDLTDLGTASADGLTWTFKMKQGIKYQDGSTVKVEDLAYAIKRSFAHDVFQNGPTYQLQYFKDADTYKGPYTSGDNCGCVETQGTDTLIVHLKTKFPDLPFYMTFPMFTPIPKDKDTKDQYGSHPMTTGPYKLDVWTPGQELKLSKNSNWDPATDPLRHQYADNWDFKWGVDHIKAQQQVINSNNSVDAATYEYDNIDASLAQQAKSKSGQLLQGSAPCTIVINLDSRKIPLEVRKAVALAFNYDSDYTAAGLNDLVADPASTIMPPGEPGYQKYTPYPGLTGQGKGDPAAAKAALQAAGKAGFELSWYYDNTKPVPQQQNQAWVAAFTAAGFTTKPIGVSTADLRKKTRDYNAPVNMWQGPRGWCHDWPSGSTWFPPLMETHSISDGQSWGFFSDPAQDQEIDAIAALPVDQAAPKWGAEDQKLMGLYPVLPRYYNKVGNVYGTGLGGLRDDVTLGIAMFPDMFVKS